MEFNYKCSAAMKSKKKNIKWSNDELMWKTSKGEKIFSVF